MLILFSTPSQAFDPCHADEQKYTKIADRYQTGLLFKISKCHVEPSYLLGTMHSDDPQLASLLRGAFGRLVYAKSASFEIDFNDENTKTIQAEMFYPRGGVESLQGAIQLSLYTKFVQVMAILHPEMSQDSYYNFKPWAAAVILDEPPNTADGIALDMRLENLAKSRNIPVYGLESAAEQTAIFTTIPVNKQIEFLKDSLEHYQQAAKDNADLIKLYYKQDLKSLQILSDKSFNTITDQTLAHQLKIDLIDKRNQNMAERMAPRIDEGNAFIAIGALHLTGELGVLKLLEDKGYFIDVVSDSPQ